MIRCCNFWRATYMLVFLVKRFIGCLANMSTIYIFIFSLFRFIIVVFFFFFFFQRQRNNIRIIITSMGINTLYSVLIKNLLILTKLCRVSHKKGDPNIKFTFTKIYRKLSKKNCFRK